MTESDNRDFSPAVVLLILLVAVLTLVIALVAPLTLDFTAIEGVDKSTSGVISNVSVDDEDTNGDVVMVFSVGFSEPIDRVELYQQNGDNTTLVEKTAVLPEERVTTVRVEGVARTQHEFVAYRGGQVVGSAELTVRDVPLQKQLRNTESHILG